MKPSPDEALRRRVRSFLDRTGMTREAFALALGKQSGSAWTSQWLTGRIKGTTKTTDAIETLMASKEPAPARMTSFPAEPPPALPVDEWTTTAIAEKLRTTAAALGIGERSLFSLAADRLDALNNLLALIYRQIEDATR